MSLPSCDSGDEYAYELCPGRDMGIHYIWCKHWDIRPQQKLEQAVGPGRAGREPGAPGKVVGGLLPYDAASAYELTMTTTKDDPYELRQFLQKIVESKAFAVKGWSACIELQANGMPHIYAVLYSEKNYLDASKIKNRIKFPYRFELKRVKSLNNYFKYLKKEDGNASIIEYCLKKGIPQFWENAV